MKRFYCLVLMVLLMVTGCSTVMPAERTPAPANQPPVAYIDSLSASQIVPGDKVSFTGHGVDPDGSIIAYRWWSSSDGDLSTESSFSTASLSPGAHSIWFKVQDNQGSWSKEVSSTVDVVPVSERLPSIKLFEAIPPEIGTGKFSTLSWDVSNASHVEIDNYIGSVPSTGNKAVSPSSNTMYKLTASNKNGSVASTAGVTILTKPTYTKEMYTIADESGHVRADGEVGTEPQAGVLLKVHSGVAVEAFLSYDISGIPQGKKIRSVYMDASAARIYGDPFSFLGSMYIYVYGYRQLSSKDYIEAYTGSPIYTAGGLSNKLLSSARMTEAVQAAVDSGSTRFQIRVQFALCKCRQEDIGHIDFGGAGSKLIVQYQD